jgi:hypothetical protein
VERLLVQRRTKVGAIQDGDVAQRDPSRAKLADAADDGGGLILARLVGANHRLQPRGCRRAQRLRRTSELRRQPVREREDLRRGAVVLLESDHGRRREPPGDVQEVSRRRAGERVDRLIVVADDAEIVALAGPQEKQRLLEQVHVLVLVDREGAVALSELSELRLVLLEGPDGQLELVLVVDLIRLRLAPLVLPIDARHQLRRERRCATVSAQRRDIAVSVKPTVLRPLDLGRDVRDGTVVERLSATRG